MIEVALAIAKHGRTEVVRPELHRYRSQDPSPLIGDRFDGSDQRRIGLEYRVGLGQSEDVGASTWSPAIQIVLCNIRRD